MHIILSSLLRISYRNVGFALIFIALGSLAAALVAQYVFGLLPCILCIYQRVPYVVIAALSIIGLFTPLKIARALTALCGLTFLVGAGIATFHVGVEQHWWAFNTCSATLNTTDIDALREQLLNAPSVRCDEIAWSLFGISMAGYNVLMSLGLGVLTLYYISVRKVA